MPQNVIPVYKNKGETPLQALEKLTKMQPELAGLPLTYAGRLDPLAEGVLLVLAGDECKKKDEYLQFQKEYLVTLLFGFETDTYDVLGKIVDAPSSVISERSSDLLAQNSKNERGQTISNITADFASVIKNFTGNIIQSYPPYSSRPVEGKPLFQWAREDRLGEITIPTHEVSIQSIDVVDTSVITGTQLQKKIHDDISLVIGDFRQEEILALWDSALDNTQEAKFKTVTLRVACGSGAYMRALAYDIGKTLGIPALALDIVRTKVGEYTI